MPDHSRIAMTMEALRSLHCLTPADEEFQLHLDRLLRRDAEGQSIPEPIRFGRTQETRGILFVDAAGAGKTTTVSRGLAKHPAFCDRHASCSPYLNAIVPTDPTLKSMAFSLLTRAGHPIERTRRTTFQLFEQLRDLMHRNGQVVLWINEAHDLFCRDRDQILRATKSLMRCAGSVIVVLSGTESLEEIVRSDPQVQRRFTIVKPAPIDVATDGGRLVQIMQEYCLRAGIDPLDDSTLPSRLVLAARHRFGRAVELMQDAVEQALLEEKKALDLWHFDQVWGMHETRDVWNNPFIGDDWDGIDPDAPTEKPKLKMKARSKK